MIWIFGLTLTLYGFFTQDILAQDLAQNKIFKLGDGVVDRQTTSEAGILRPTVDVRMVKEFGEKNQSVIATGNDEHVIQHDDGKETHGTPSGDGFQAYATAYTRESSCHFRTTRNGREICPMASGKDVYVGAVACPRNLKLGTKIKIMDTTYTCEDRYSNRLDNIRGLPTIDIFMLVSNETAIKFGKRKVYVEIIKN